MKKLVIPKARRQCSD